MAMDFRELDVATRESMMRQFEIEEASGEAFRSASLSPLGLMNWPDLMRAAIEQPDGNEETLALSLRPDEFWNLRDRSGVVNVEAAAARLALTEFNTWYVSGLAHKLVNEGESSCRVYRATFGTTGVSICSDYENETFPLTEVIDGHRIHYWPRARIDRHHLSIPNQPNCHHTIERL